GSGHDALWLSIREDIYRRGRLYVSSGIVAPSTAESRANSSSRSSPIFSMTVVIRSAGWTGRDAGCPPSPVVAPTTLPPGVPPPATTVEYPYGQCSRPP